MFNRIIKSSASADYNLAGVGECLIDMTIIKTSCINQAVPCSPARNMKQKASYSKLDTTSFYM